MGKGKPRHNPDKPANKRGGFCKAYEEFSDGSCNCSYPSPHSCKEASVCKGNPHNCIKTKYRRAASRSDIQKINGV